MPWVQPIVRNWLLFEEGVPVLPPSTVVALDRQGRLELLREGTIPFAEVEREHLA